MLSLFQVTLVDIDVQIYSTIEVNIEYIANYIFSPKTLLTLCHVKLSLNYN
jgi:hypothetical protein